MELAEFGKCMAALTAAIGKPMPKEQAGVYFEMLQDLTVEQLQLGVKRAICEHEFNTVPSVATLRRLAFEQDSGSEVVQASERVLKARKLAYYEPAKALALMGDDRARAAMEAIGGLGRLSDLTAENIATYAAQFRDAYSKLEKGEKRERILTGVGIGFTDETKKLASSLKGIE